MAQRALLAREAREARDPELAADAKRLLAVRRELAMLSMAAGIPGQVAARNERLASLEQQEATLSRSMTQAGGQTGTSQPWVELDEVRGALGVQTVLVEIARFRVQDFAVKATAAFGPAHYAAWIIPPAGQGAVQIVDLGEAEKIDQAVEAARRTLMHPAGAARRGLAAEDDQAEAQQAFREAPAALSALVLQPILAQTGQARNLILSPDASLWLVPWAPCRWPTGATRSSSTRFNT